jgi:hypothetical protein
VWVVFGQLCATIDDNAAMRRRNATELADRDAAWTEMTSVCGDLVGSISRNLKQNAEWHMELLDETKKPLFRIRLVAETLD